MSPEFTGKQALIKIEIKKKKMSNGSGADKDAKRTAAGSSSELLHQRRRMPYSNTTMAIGGFLIVAAIGYLALYYKSKPGTKPSDVARATVAADRKPKD